MAILISASTFGAMLLLIFIAWRRYLRAADRAPDFREDSCEFSLTDSFDDHYLVNVPHQQNARWLTDIFSRSARKYPHLTALQIPHSNDSLTFAELDAEAENIAAAIAPYLTGPDQVVAVAMEQDNRQIVASHLGVLKAGGTLVFLDSSLPEPLIKHMLDDAQPVLVLTRGITSFREMPTLDVLSLPENTKQRKPPGWLDDPGERLATIFYTSGTTGKPKGVEVPHAGYVNLALSYADYFDLIAGMDATTLTSSLGYDGSISEMYSAWVSGCSVVLLTSEQVRSGPELLPVLRDAEVTVLFCPPVLLTTLTPEPEIDLPYPLCRYIVPAGESFPGNLVEPWTRARRQVINTYGPTEASTDTSRQSLRAGEPVTIGPPLPNVTYVILETGQLAPVPHGQPGELCIGGVHLARGYRNLPEQTAEKFISHPQFGRLYRTGDRCSIDGRTQRVHFLGRIDSQLKVRGHRVEVQPVEDVLQTQFAEIEAAVLDYQNGELVAFVTAPSIAKADAPALDRAPAAWEKEVLSSLAAQLPGPAVPMRIFVVNQFVMKPVSGKIDRSSLPSLARLTPGSEIAGNKPRGANLDAAGISAAEISQDPVNSDTTSGSGEVLAICRQVFGAPLGWDDTFAEHGGHSIVIAQLAQRLQSSGWNVSVRALLSDCNTARKIAHHPRPDQRATVSSAHNVQATAKSEQRDEAAARVLSPRWFTVLQALFLLLLYAPVLCGFLALVVAAEIGEFFMTASLAEFIGVGFFSYLFALIFPFASLFWVLFIKLLMGGHIYRNKVTPGVYPKWSRMHLRSWCIGRMENSVIRPLAALFRSAPLMAYVLRRLGADVGDNLQCAHDVELSGPLHLLSTGDNVTIQTGAYIHTSWWSAHGLHIGPIRLEDGCKIGMRAAVAGGVTVGRDSLVTPFTPILEDVGPGEVWEGAPATFSGRCTKLRRAENLGQPACPAWCMESLNILMQVLLDFLLLVVPVASLTWFTGFFIPARETDTASEYFRITPWAEIAWHMSLFTFITTWGAIVLTSVLICLFLRLTAFTPGLYPTRSLRGYLLLYRVKKMNLVQRHWTWTVTGQYLRALAGMRFPRVGGSECDHMFNLVPELARADSQVFWSNGSFTNMLDYGAKHIELRQLDMPRNFFSGNNCVAEYGQYPSNFLLGVSTPASDIRFRRQMRTRPGESISIAGNLPIRFSSAQFEEENEAQVLPGFPLFLARVFLNDIFSIGLLQNAGIFLYVIFFTGLMRWDGPLLVSALCALICAEFALVAACAAIKKALVGNTWGSGHKTPFWSWRHFSYFFAQDCFFTWCRRLLRYNAGTVMSNYILRLMGCRVGKRTIISSPMQASDWNAVDFGNDCMINGFMQFHTFENMTLRVKRAEIRDGCTINFGATVMGGAVIEPGSTLLPLTLVLKEMHLPAAVYHGSPVDVTW